MSLPMRLLLRMVSELSLALWEFALSCELELPALWGFALSCELETPTLWVLEAAAPPLCLGRCFHR